MNSLFRSVLSFSVIVLSACSSYAPPTDWTGASKDQVVARLGQPDVQRQLGGGITRLEFPTGPYGRHTWFVDLDATGQVVRSEQVLTEKNFNQITPGMDQAEVRQRLGRPGEKRALARARGEVWAYRYENQFCLWYQLEFAPDRTLRSAGYGEPPECDRPQEIIIPN